MDRPAYSFPSELVNCLQLCHGEAQLVQNIFKKRCGRKELIKRCYQSNDCDKASYTYLKPDLSELISKSYTDVSFACKNICCFLLNGIDRVVKGKL